MVALVAFVFRDAEFREDGTRGTPPRALVATVVVRAVSYCLEEVVVCGGGVRLTSAMASSCSDDESSASASQLLLVLLLRRVAGPR